ASRRRQDAPGGSPVLARIRVRRRARPGAAGPLASHPRLILSKPLNPTFARHRRRLWHARVLMGMPAHGRVILLAGVLAAGASACGGSGAKHQATTASATTAAFVMPSPNGTAVIGPFGSGAREVWVFRPKHRAPRALVILVHGRGDTDP